MSLSLMMRGNWDGLSMASPQLQSYKPERPVYSTPHPVQSTPANNECKLVELRGADVASFVIGDEEYICLPQAFDLFLKHLVGGLHTVYTKLKRLNITPVVCNVEQVRVLRGLGAIQPGVNRCKLITRKDFETLYQDCTTASRPGRPPKRYPVLPPADLMSHHPSARTLNHPRGILGSPDLGNFHKRLRLDHEGNFHQQQERRMSTSPTRHSPSMSRKYATGAEELYANAANIYLQQALRQQYQQFLANGIHNGMNSQHGANVNAALAPFIGMSNPGFFNGSIPQHILSHINEYARNNIGDSAMNEREERDEQTSPGGSPHQQKPGNSIKPFPTPQRRQSLGRSHENSAGASESDNDIDDMRRERPTTSPRQGFNRGMNDRSSPATPRSPSGRKSVGDASASSSDYGKKYEGDNCQDRSLSRGQETEELNSTHAKYHGGKGNNIIKTENQRNQSGSDDLGDWQTAMPSTPNISCMQTLLSNIQGLLKVAADNAKLQDKQLSFEIAELKNRVTKEQELRGLVERKLEESERIRASIQRKLDREREAVRRLQEQKNDNNEKSPSKEVYKQNDDDIDVTSSPSENGSPHRSLTASPQNHASRSESTREGNCPSTESNTCSEFAAHASPASVSSPKSINDYWGGRQMNVNRNQSPERTSPVNMAGNERNWMACNLVRSSAK